MTKTLPTARFKDVRTTPLDQTKSPSGPPSCSQVCVDESFKMQTYMTSALHTSTIRNTGVTNSNSVSQNHILLQDASQMQPLCLEWPPGGTPVAEEYESGGTVSAVFLHTDSEIPRYQTSES